MENTKPDRIGGIEIPRGLTKEQLKNIVAEAWKHAGVLVDGAEFDECYVYGERELARVLKMLPAQDFHDMLKIKANIELQHLCEMGKFNPSLIEEKSEEIARYCNDAMRTAEAR